jgi:hypothetical protein
MTIGSPACVGTIDQVMADQAIQPFKSQLEACYVSGLGAHPGLNGRVMARVSIGPEGEIMDHKITQSALEGAPEVDACIDNVLASLKYQPLGPQKTAACQYPLLFSPG